MNPTIKAPKRGIFEKEPGSNDWSIRYVDGQGKYRREHVGPYSLAEQLLVTRKADALRRKKLPETLRRRFVPFSEIADDALVYSEAHKRSYRDDKSRMAKLKEWWGSRDASSIEDLEMEKRLTDAARDEKWAASTFNHYRSLLMMVYRCARKNKKIQTNPAREIEHRKEDNDRVRYLGQHRPLPTEIAYLKALKTEEERLRAVIQHDYPKHFAEFELAISTGLRKGSMYAVTFEMVNWNGRMLHIPADKMKSGRPLHIPLNQAALGALRSIDPRQEKTGDVFQSEKTGEALTNSRHWFEKAVEKAGIVDFTWHDLRHCFASKLRMRGAKLEDIAELLGHSRKTGLAMTKRYAHLGPNQLHQVAALLDSDSTPVAPATVRKPANPVSFVN